jgi:hypothetical protein
VTDGHLFASGMQHNARGKLLQRNPRSPCEVPRQHHGTRAGTCRHGTCARRWRDGINKSLLDRPGPKCCGNQDLQPVGGGNHLRMIAGNDASGTKVKTPSSGGAASTLARSLCNRSAARSLERCSIDDLEESREREPSAALRHSLERSLARRRPRRSTPVKLTMRDDCDDATKKGPRSLLCLSRAQQQLH